LDEGGLGGSGKRSPDAGREDLVIAGSKALIFDFDGTLARTMEDNFAAWRATLLEYGIDLKPEDYYPLEGLSVYELPGRLFGKYHQRPPAPKRVVEKKEAYYLKNHRFLLYPGAETLIDLFCSRQIPQAIVTTALRTRLVRSVPQGFLAKFHGVVTGEDTSEGKPSPAPYLKGAEKLGVKPEDCLVVENAPLGIESAKRAGAYCIGVCNTLGRQYLGQADEVVESLQDLPLISKVKELLGNASSSHAKKRTISYQTYGNSL
jgi:beta-phosphoglucomutase